MIGNMDLQHLNQLQPNTDGVLLPPGETDRFNYSDGAEVEQRLAQIFDSTDNLRSDSAELEQQITDWPSEYHLSGARANLLRGLDLKGCQRVLELGCGCGAITRYLGEQGMQVDAVEGSLIRASLARKRCAGLERVNIVSANFNTLQFAEDHYDLVLFVGVMEYAGRFSSEPSDEAAVGDMLRLANQTVHAEGMVVIAIENRLGLKYICGACEDHYGVPDVGLKDYPESSGIKTYDRNQWQQLIDASAFDHADFLLALPDYKLPTLLLREDIPPEDLSALKPALSAVVSRDYLREFSLGEDEADIWSSLITTASIKHYANSYLIILSKTLRPRTHFAGANWQAWVTESIHEQNAGPDHHESKTAILQWVSRLKDRLARWLKKD